VSPILSTITALLPNTHKIKFLLEGQLTIKKFKKGEIIVKEGEISPDLYFIFKGFVRAFCKNEKDEPISVWFLKENRFAGSIKSHCTGLPSNISIQAIENCTLIVFKKELLEYIFNNPDVAAMYRKKINECFIEMEETAILLQSKNAIQKYEELLTKKPWVIQRAPLNHVASYLGITQSTLSRLRAKIKQ
jgi:CRP/FNR family transcriptional regulator, anaerobic regulatory protein